MPYSDRVMMDGPLTRPSSPSVMFTAFTMEKYANTMNAANRSGAGSNTAFLTNGRSTGVRHAAGTGFQDEMKNRANGTMNRSCMNVLAICPNPNREDLKRTFWRSSR